ncbi:hypothetical protein, partial [Microvirga tunisiensis]|uniref:hypothetical protein n=1 Tax=Microvirga tunisiensis TaxID=2108360 RepID=UPI001AED4FE4
HRPSSPSDLDQRREPQCVRSCPSEQDRTSDRISESLVSDRTLAHPNPAMIGKDQTDAKDSTGNLFTQQQVQVA